MSDLVHDLPLISRGEQSVSCRPSGTLILPYSPRHFRAGLQIVLSLGDWIHASGMPPTARAFTDTCPKPPEHALCPNCRKPLPIGKRILCHRNTKTNKRSRATSFPILSSWFYDRHFPGALRACPLPELRK